MDYWSTQKLFFYFNGNIITCFYHLEFPMESMAFLNPFDHLKVTDMEIINMSSFSYSKCQVCDQYG